MTLFRVSGLPIPQGHVRTVTKGGRTWSFHGSPGLAAWREAITAVAQDAMRGQPGPYDGPVEVVLTFHMPRPKSHLRANGQVKPDAPTFVTTRPDIDRLARSVLDAISVHPGPVLADDSKVVVLYAAKSYCAPGEGPGVTVLVSDLVGRQAVGLDPTRTDVAPGQQALDALVPPG